MIENENENEKPELVKENIGYNMVDTGNIEKSREEISGVTDEKTEQELYDLRTSSISVPKNIIMLELGDIYEVNVITSGITNVPLLSWLISDLRVINRVDNLSNKIRAQKTGTSTLTLVNRNDLTQRCTILVEVYDRGSIPSYTLTVNGGPGGTVSGGGTYKRYETATIKAIPESRHVFKKWVDLESEEKSTAEFTVTVTKSNTWTAEFEALDKIITVSSSDGSMGKVKFGEEAPVVSFTKTLELGTQFTIEAVSIDPGYKFSKWSDENIENPRTMTATSDLELTAAFKPAGDKIIYTSTSGDAINNFTDASKFGSDISFQGDDAEDTHRVAKYSGDVTMVGGYAFDGCTGLTSIVLPGTVTELGESAFYGCTGMTSISIPGSVTNIDMGVFQYCTGLASISIPESVTNIGNNAFYNCTNLMSITSLNPIPPTIQSNTFNTVQAGCDIYVPAGSVDAYKGAENWSARAEHIKAITE